MKKIFYLFIAFTLSSSISNADSTFSVNDCEIAKELLPEKSYSTIIEQSFLNKFGYKFYQRNSIEAFSQSSDTLIQHSSHPFIYALSHAFNEHRPIIISPDMIWLMICHGISQHINQNPEQFRNIFVNHSGKIELKVIRNDFIKGNRSNPWQDIFPQFSLKIKNNVKNDIYELIVTNFSTTDSTKKAVFELSLMDTMKNYFSYSFYTMCGIPQITLEGKTSDWEMILNKIRCIDKSYELDWWTKELIPILEEFVNASKGIINKKHWNGIFKYIPPNRGSGSVPYINGWITKFFPYLTSKSKNNSLRPNKTFSQKIEFDDLPSGLTQTPFKWYYLSNIYDMLFTAGFVGIHQDKKTKALRTEIGWVIIETKDSK